MGQQNQTIQIAQLFIDLEKCRSLIRTEITPACLHLAPQETIELTDSLELAAAAIDDHLRQYRLAVERRADEKR